MKAITFNLLFIISIVGSWPTDLFAQNDVDVHNLQHKALTGDVWDTFDLLMYRVDKKNGKTVYTPHFPAKLARMNSKTVKLEGYMIPLRSAVRHNSFLFSVLPLHQCMFCGTNGIPAMIEVSLAGNKKEKIKEHPITITGVVHLNGTDKTRTEILLVDCRLVTPTDQ